MKDYQDCKWSFIKPTEREALKRATECIKHGESIPILYMEQLHMLTTNGNLKKQWADLFKRLNIKTGFEDED